MDENGAGARGGRSGKRQQDASRTADSHQEYSWESKPGEDFGPIAPPPSTTPSTGPPPPGTGFGMSRSQTNADTVRIAAATPTTTDSRSRRRSWRPIFPVLGVLVVLAGLIGGALVVLSRQSATRPGEPVAQVTPPPVLAVASTVASPSVVAKPAVGGSPAASIGSPVAAGSPAPVLGLGTVVPGTPAPASNPGATSPQATSRTLPAASATLPSLISPPGLRFPTSTPARIVATRTPPPIPTLRPAVVNPPLRVDRSLYKVGEDASVCAQASTGSSAQILVMMPDSSQRTLGEFQPPADRVCQAFRLDTPGTYVLTLTVKDSTGREVERHATVVTAAR